MAQQDDDEELSEVRVSARNRNPSIGRRWQDADKVFPAGTRSPRMQAAMNPTLYRERLDTNNLISQAFADDGPLAGMTAENPLLAEQIRDQAETPMAPAQHRQFRSAIMQLVGAEVERETKTRNQIADNTAFMRIFSAMDAAIPGLRDPKRHTLEEEERRQIEIGYNQAQELALLDPDASKAVMADVRRRADALTANVRTHIEQVRKAARLDDSELWSNATEQLNETNDVIASLQHDTDKRGRLKSPNDALIGRATALLGRSGSLPRAGLGEAAGANVGSQVGAQMGGTKGALVAVAGDLAGKIVDKFTESGDVRDLIERLQFNAQLIQQGYEQNRAALAKKYSPYGIEFGAEPGEVYATINEAYRAEAEKIPAKVQTPEESASSKNMTLRMMLQRERDNAAEAEAAVRPEASAGMRGSDSRLAAAIERSQMASDDLEIFEDDLRQAGSTDALPLPEGAPPPDTKAARARRQARGESRVRSQIRQGIMEALRSYTR
jgi:hypothetical protein